MMVKNPINFIKKANHLLNSYFINNKNIQKKINKNLRKVNKVQKSNTNLEKKIENLETQLSMLKNDYQYESHIIQSYFEEIFKQLELEKKYCPICNKSTPIFLPFGETLRNNAACPSCGSLERHRLAYLYLKNETNIFNNSLKLLHFAPERIFADIFEKSNNIDYWPVDLFRKDDIIRENVDMQNIPYENNSFDVIFTSHVLEHVPDDYKALKELLRVIKPKSEGGFVVIMVPINYNMSKTLEKEEYNTPELRSKYYGQFDHLRLYGTDFQNKLISTGFKVKKYNKYDFLDETQAKKYSIHIDEIFVCTKEN